MITLPDFILLGDDARADSRGLGEDGTRHLLPDLAYKRLLVVNVCFYGNPVAYDSWVLIDAGVPGTLISLKQAAEVRFGGRPPSVIVLTHAHPDHVGSLQGLCQEWKCPVYAHPLEHPYLNGQASYPSPDPGAAGGLLSKATMARNFKPAELGDRLRSLPEDGTIPFMPGWRWLHTPGHSAGHISLWRQSDRVLLAGDALVTTTPQSAFAVNCHELAVCGPPHLSNSERELAGRSLGLLAALEPELILSGHGRAVRGLSARQALTKLARGAAS
ncbi:MBL fold metallo-hydrolase, partial [bacterium]|nr:MBL fold metallo-hydrolase [bacterium]